MSLVEIRQLVDIIFGSVLALMIGWGWLWVCALLMYEFCMHIKYVLRQRRYRFLRKKSRSVGVHGNSNYN